MHKHNLHTIKLKGGLVELKRPLVMGILNLTPDSFFDGGKYLFEKEIIDRVEELINQGVDIIDVGAFSSRPGAQLLTVEQELERLEKGLEVVKRHGANLPLSVDTCSSKVAEFVIDNYGADIINDISGGQLDDHMFKTVAKHKVAYVLMHMKGTPQSMQLNPQYKDVVKEVSLFFARQVDQLRSLGTTDIILDPGFGFGKSELHNYQVLNGFDQFLMHDLPLLAGVSRKSMIYKPLEIKPGEALNGTTALHMVALLKGASILRVHDVKEAIECIKLVQKLNNASSSDDIS